MREFLLFFLVFFSFLFSIMKLSHPHPQLFFVRCGLEQKKKRCTIVLVVVGLTHRRVGTRVTRAGIFFVQNSVQKQQQQDSNKIAVKKTGAHLSQVIISREYYLSFFALHFLKFSMIFTKKSARKFQECVGGSNWRIIFCKCCRYISLQILLTWWQFVLDKGYFDVFAFFVITTDLKNKTFLMGSDPFLRHTLHHLGHCHLQSFFTLCWKKKKHEN